MRTPARMWISPAGAAIALICFFLPWFDVSCGKTILTQHGYDQGWPFWTVPVAALGMLVAFGVAWKRGDPARARPYIVGLSVVLPGLLILLALMAILGTQFGFRPVVPGEERYHAVRYGLVGEIFGLLAALLGTAWLRPSARTDERAGAG